MMRLITEIAKTTRFRVVSSKREVQATLSLLAEPANGQFRTLAYFYFVIGDMFRWYKPFWPSLYRPRGPGTSFGFFRFLVRDIKRILLARCGKNPQGFFSSPSTNQCRNINPLYVRSPLENLFFGTRQSKA